MFNYAYNLVHRLAAPDAANNSPDASSSPSTSSSSSAPSPSSWTEPSYADVHVAKAMLARAGHLPLELVDVIIDLAEYWPHTTTKLFLGHAGSGSQTTSFTGNAFLIRTPPLGFFQPPYPDHQAYARSPPVVQPMVAHACTADEARRWLGRRAPRVAHPCRRIVFQLVSRDQGWTSSPRDRSQPFKGAYSWFDAGLERFEVDEGTDTPPPPSSLRSVRPPIRDTGRVQDGAPVYDLAHPLLPDEYRLQMNRVAKRQLEKYTIVWNWTDNASPDGETALALDRMGRGGSTGDGSFVRSLQVGDVVTLWAKARFPGWSNNVQSVEIAVYWAV